MGILLGKLQKLNANPYISYWMKSSLGGKTPVLEEEKDLRIRRVVKRAYDGQNRIGWDNLTKGRMSGKMIQLQEWWEKERNLKRDKKSIDSKEALTQVLAIGLQCRYELWKKRSAEVIEEEGPSKIVVLMKEVQRREREQGKVERRDRFLFSQTKVPTKEDREQRIKDWLEAVKMSIRRKERKEEKEAGKLANMMERFAMIRHA